MQTALLQTPKQNREIVRARIYSLGEFEYGVAIRTEFKRPHH